MAKEKNTNSNLSVQLEVTFPFYEVKKVIINREDKWSFNNTITLTKEQAEELLDILKDVLNREGVS